MSFTCRVCGAWHYADMFKSRRCKVCHQMFCLDYDPQPSDGFHHNCGVPAADGNWKCNKCNDNPPGCTYSSKCNNKLVEGEYTPCKACVRPMCGDHLQTSEICEECWKAGRRTPFIDPVLQKKGWNVEE